ncbi:MAG: SH3 domain-containing protein, partial [Planctomycetota bacterium]
ILLMIATAAVSAPSVEFPYEAYVLREGAVVRAGPGQAYPASLRLRFGERVEVYRHDPGGWCAIRPPDGAFSWVRADGIELLPNGLGRVRHDGVPSMVGDPTQEGGAVAWVELLAGELVEVLDAKSVHAPSATGVPESSRQTGQLWYKIAPPSGEFRWIHRSYLRPVDDVQGGLIAPAVPAEGDPQSDDSVRLTAGAEPSAHEAGWRPKAMDPEDVRSSARVAMLDQASGDIASPPVDATPKAGKGEDDHPTSVGSDSQPLVGDLVDLEIELSAVLVQEPGLWRLDDLEQRAKSLMEDSRLDVLARAKARAIWNKIRKAQEIAQLARGTGRSHDAAAPRLLPSADVRSKRLPESTSATGSAMAGSD